MSVSPKGRTYYTKKEYNQLIADLELYKKEQAESLLKRSAGLLLDSSLISQTNTKNYTHKIIQCGKYFQVYNYTSKRVKKDTNIDFLQDKKGKVKTKKKNIAFELVKKDVIQNNSLEELEEKFGLSNSKSRYEELQKMVSVKEKSRGKKKIELKNILRSKNQLQRLVKANELEFKTFITLTFAKNEKRIEVANKCFNSWRTYIKRLKNDFKYVCVPEFQKRGAVHYHLLTNIDYTDFSLLSKDEKKLWSPYSKKWEIGRNIVGWKEGYSLVKNMDNINVVIYITKYMTKNIDNRLWGKRRYLYSLNLKQPSVIYLDEENEKENSHLLMIELLLKETYKNKYCDKLGQVIEFIEFKE